jgi:hypothetical protein
MAGSIWWEYRLNNFLGMAAGFGWRVSQGRGVNSISSCRNRTLSTGWLTAMTILVADDNRFSREAVNGCKALDLIALNQPDLVFLDLRCRLRTAST